MVVAAAAVFVRHLPQGPRYSGTCEHQHTFGALAVDSNFLHTDRGGWHKV